MEDARMGGRRSKGEHSIGHNSSLIDSLYEQIKTNYPMQLSWLHNIIQYNGLQFGLKKRITSTSIPVNEKFERIATVRR